MKLGEVLEEIDRVQPNDCTERQKIRWIRQLDMNFWQGVVQRCEGGENIRKPSYDENTGLDTELLAPEPWDGIYVSWLQAMICLELGETARYNNAYAVYAAMYSQMSNQWRREHMPKGEGRKYF